MENAQANENALQSSLKILIAEDNEATSRLIDRTLVRAGFRPARASTGAETIEIITRNPDTLVLLDYRLPDMTAKEIIYQLGQTHSVAPFIVMTGEGDERIAVEMMKLGARDYVIKDGDFLEFLPQVVKRVSTQLATEAELRQTRAKLKDSERTLLSLLSNLHGMAYRGHIDDERKMSFVSEGIIGLIGYNPSDLTGERSISYIDLIHSNDRDMVLSEIRSAVKQQCPFQITYRLQCANGGEKWVLEKGDGIFSPEGEFLAVEGFITDITGRKKAEEEIRQKNAELLATQNELRDVNMHLEGKVRERTIQIEKMLKEKEDFISQLAHDLRSPLTPLVALVPMLGKGSDVSRSGEILDVIGRNVQYMKNLVEKTVQLAAINSSKVELNIRKVNLSQVLVDVIRRKSHNFSERNITIENKIDRKIIIPADDLLVMEVLDNLISNAIKFMPPEGGTLTFDARLDDKFNTISIRDSGIGLTAEQASHIFEEFYKVDESRHELGSAGLGLTICSRIMKKHEGKIWVESEGLEKGSTFYLSFPVYADKAEEFVLSVEEALGIKREGSSILVGKGGPCNEKKDNDSR